MMEARYFKIGVFVLSSLAIGIVFLVAFAGGGKGPALMFETYIEESVQGLEVGSPVRIQGVPIGRVESIGFVLTTTGSRLSSASTGTPFIPGTLEFILAPATRFLPPMIRTVGRTPCSPIPGFCISTHAETTRRGKSAGWCSTLT